MKKGVLQISFGWLFAIIVGAFIIFLAIYGVTKFMGTEQQALDAKTQQEIGILLNPLETGFESAISTSFTTASESRINNSCDDVGNFGQQLIGVSQKSFNKWTETDFEAGFSNKYIFSEGVVEGKKFYVFSKPFEFPFKVSDLIYMTSSKKTYCFADASEDIKEEIEDLNQTNLLIEDDCSGISVCSSVACDIRVRGNHVEKGNDDLYFASDALMYAAIFSDPVVYECQLKRLMKRVEELSLIYVNKADFVEGKDCDSEMIGDLDSLNSRAESFSDSEDLLGMISIVEGLENSNDRRGVCGLW